MAGAAAGMELGRGAGLGAAALVGAVDVGACRQHGRSHRGVSMVLIGVCPVSLFSLSSHVKHPICSEHKFNKLSRHHPQPVFNSFTDPSEPAQQQRLDVQENICRPSLDRHLADTLSDCQLLSRRRTVENTSDW